MSNGRSSQTTDINTPANPITSAARFIISTCCGSLSNCACATPHRKKITAGTLNGICFAAACIIIGTLIACQYEGEDAQKIAIKKIGKMLDCVAHITANLRHTTFSCSNPNNEQIAVSQIKHYLHNNIMTLVIGLLVAIPGAILAGAMGFGCAYLLVNAANRISTNGVSDLRIPHFPNMTSARAILPSPYQRQRDEESSDAIELGSPGPGRPMQAL